MTWSKYLARCMSWHRKVKVKKINMCRRLDLNVQEKAPFICFSVLEQSPSLIRKCDGKINQPIMMSQGGVSCSSTLVPTRQIRCLYLPLAVVSFHVGCLTKHQQQCTIVLGGFFVLFLKETVNSQLSKQFPRGAFWKIDHTRPFQSAWVKNVK